MKDLAVTASIRNSSFPTSVLLLAVFVALGHAALWAEGSVVMTEGVGAKNISVGLCETMLTGAQEVPAAATAATGTASFVPVDGGIQLTVTHTVANPTAAHIHKAGPGVNGPVVINLVSGVSPIVITLSLEQYLQITQVPHYINVHSQTFPGGEIRGDIVGCPIPDNLCETSLTGSQEVPPLLSTSSGKAVFVRVDENIQLIVAHTVTSPTAAHVHTGAPGVNGPVVINLGNGVSPIVVTLTPGQYAEITGTSHYINVHSASYPGGEIRGDIVGCPSIEGEGETVTEGEGEVLTEGEGEALTEGEGEVLTEGEGEALTEGEGEALTEGEGEALTEGEGEALTEGEGEEEEACGCCSRDGKTFQLDDGLQRSLGDWLLAGISLFTLLALGTKQ